MSRYVITFEWEETDEIDYELLMAELIGLGAEDISDEIAADRPQEPQPERRKKDHLQ